MDIKSILPAAMLLICTYSNAQWSGSTTSTGAIYRSGNVAVGYSNILTTTGKLSIKGTTYATDFMIGTNEDLFFRPGKSTGSVIFSIGNVGIGLTTPTQKLEVNGTVKATSFIGSGAQLTDLPSSPWVINPSTQTLFYSSGNVGIGLSAPTEKLEVNGNLKSCGFILKKPQGSIHFDVAEYAGYGSHISRAGDGIISLRNPSPTESYHGLIFNMMDNNNDGNSYIKFVDEINDEILGIYNNSIVRVDGKFIAKEIEVKTNVWGDFVFDKNYSLISLEDLEKYINENRHLPGVPSEKEVLENGINVGDMNAIMMQKIEELTLYLIEQEKRIKELEKEVKELKENAKP